MVLAASNAAAGATPYLIALAGSGGVLGAALGFFKLRGDRDSQAVTRAQGAMETMQILNQALEEELDRANQRAELYRLRCEQVTQELDDVRRRWGPFPAEQ